MKEELSSATFNLLVASKLPGVGKVSLRQIAEDSAFYKTPIEDLSDLHPSLRSLVPSSPKFESAKFWANEQIEKSIRLKLSIVGYWDAAYPAMLRASPSAPALLWCRGNPESLSMPAVTIIGTRQPTSAGIAAAKRISAAVASQKMCVVSGLALGIDSYAHESCVEVFAPTVAVMAGGLDSISPRRNYALSEEIINAGGALVSEFPIGAPSLPMNFVTRDVTQAALSSAVILVQSDRTGGSMHASRAIVQMKRKLFVVAPFLRDIQLREPKIEGNLALLSGDVTKDLKMGFPKEVMSQVVPLRSREDYPMLFETIMSEWARAKASRRSPPASA